MQFVFPSVILSRAINKNDHPHGAFGKRSGVFLAPVEKRRQRVSIGIFILILKTIFLYMRFLFLVFLRSSPC